jgi:hypothetical protein
MNPLLQIQNGDQVVITRGKYANEPAVVYQVNLTKGRYQARTVDVLLSRTGERVTVRRTSLDLY